ncbi:MAG: hypothetical protein E7055_16290, partial [Lentisphaerae bacterium]|nr:hypothetical protein [Lentisphaerota bacterium]
MAVIKIDSFIFADLDHYEALGLSYPNVSDPIKDTKGGTLTLHGIYDAFSGTAASYTLVVDGQSWTVAAKKVTDNGNLDFTLSKMTSGDKFGIVYAVDSKGKSLESASVYFDVDDTMAPVVAGKLAATQHGNDFDLSWAAATDDSPYEWSLTV